MVPILRPGVGGRKPGTVYAPGAGRKPGSKNRATLEESVQLSVLARTHTREAVETIYEIMMDERQNGGVRIQAAESLLNRGWGKPVAQLELGRPGDFTRATDDELERYIADRARTLGIGYSRNGTSAGTD